MEKISNLDFSDVYGWALVAVLSTFVVSLIVSFQLGVFLLLFVVVGWWAWRQPQAGFLLLIVLLPILPMLKITQTIGTFTLIKDVLIFVLFLKLFLVPLLQKKLSYRPNILLAPVVAIVGWIGINFLRADSLILGVLRAREIGLYMVLYFVVLYLAKKWQNQKERLGWYFGVVAVTVLLGIYQWFFAVDSAVLRFDPVREIWIPRLSSVLAHPSIFGQWLIVAATLLLALVLYRRNRWRWIFGGMFVVTLPFIFLTYSRGVWIGMVAAVGVMFVSVAVLRLRRRFIPSAGFYGLAIGSLAITIVLLGLIVRFTPAGGLLRSAFDPTYGSNEERIEFLVRLIGPLENAEVVFGKGLGDVLEQNFREVDLTTAQVTTGDVRAVQLTKNKTLVDNQYLKTFIEMGVVGLVLYGWLYWRFGWGAWRLLSSGDIRHIIIGLWGVGFLAAFIVQGFFIDIWDVFPTNALFWIVAGLVSTYNLPRLQVR